jgi:hypothetical protein
VLGTVRECGIESESRARSTGQGPQRRGGSIVLCARRGRSQPVVSGAGKTLGSGRVVIDMFVCGVFAASVCSCGGAGGVRGCVDVWYGCGCDVCVVCVVVGGVC